MKSDGKWLTGLWLAPAESGPIPRPYVGHEVDGPDRLPLAVSLTSQEAVPTAVRATPPRPMSAVPPVPPLAVAAAAPLPMAPVTPPAMTPASSPGLRPAAQWHPATWQRDRMRAVIGDELRVPTLLCEFNGCTERYTHRDALGERDLRDRALAEGWQYDLIGRLACPACVRHAPTFWASRPQPPAIRAE